MAIRLDKDEKSLLLSAYIQQAFIECGACLAFPPLEESTNTDIRIGHRYYNSSQQEVAVVILNDYHTIVLDEALYLSTREYFLKWIDNFQTDAFKITCSAVGVNITVVQGPVEHEHFLKTSEE